MTKSFCVLKGISFVVVVILYHVLLRISLTVSCCTGTAKWVDAETVTSHKLNQGWLTSISLLLLVQINGLMQKLWQATSWTNNDWHFLSVFHSPYNIFCLESANLHMASSGPHELHARQYLLWPPEENFALYFLPTRVCVVIYHFIFIRGM